MFRSTLMLGVKENRTITNYPGVRGAKPHGGNPDSPLLSFHLFFPLLRNYIPAKLFSFFITMAHHYGSFLTSLNKKHGHNGKSSFRVAVPFLDQGASAP